MITKQWSIQFEITATRINNSHSTQIPESEHPARVEVSAVIMLGSCVLHCSYVATFLAEKMASYSHALTSFQKLLWFFPYQSTRRITSHTLSCPFRSSNLQRPLHVFNGVILSKLSSQPFLAECIFQAGAQRRQRIISLAILCFVFCLF